MQEFITSIQGIIERGLMFSPLIIAVYISSRILLFDNLSLEGAFGIGGAVTAVCIAGGLHPLLTLIIAIATGGLTGVATAFLHKKLAINHLISGILVSTGLFSIILKISGSTLSLGKKATLMQLGSSLLRNYSPLVVLVVTNAIIVVTLRWLLSTQIGMLISITGKSPQMVTNLGKSTSWYLTCGLFISNGLAGLCGSLFVQYTTYFSIWSSVGMLVVGIAGMILAELFSSHLSVALVVGSIVYQAIITLTFELQVDQEWNKLITAVLVMLFIALKNQMGKKVTT